MQSISRLLALGAGAVVIASAASACSSTTTNPTSNTPDSGPVDSGKTTKDAASSTPDAAEPDSAASTCAPGDVSKFTPPTYVPAGYKAGACTQPQIDAYFTACWDNGATQSTCDAFFKASATCAACLESTSSDAAWGPVVDYVSAGTDLGYFFNIGGCEEIVQKNTTCAKSAQGALACEMAACNPPVCDLSSGAQADYDAYYQCLDAATKVPTCKALEDAQAACSNDDGGPSSTICNGDFNKDSNAFKAFLGVFCK